MPDTDLQPLDDKAPGPSRPPKPSRAPIEGGAGALATEAVRPAAEEPPPSGFDWLTEVLIPGAVFGLLAAFFYYLIDLRGATGDRGISGLRWVCFWFLLGAILTTRMRSRYGAHILALPYILGLALAVGVFVFHVTMYSGSFVGASRLSEQAFALFFNYALVGVIWWVANLMTRSTTAEESFAAVEDEGLLSSMRRQPKGRKAADRKPQARHPGWVLMWLSLAALVVFGYGQQITGSTSEAHRRHAFLCMVAYSFFALLLLALTSLSAMRMNARKRRIRVAGGITPVWTIASALLVGVILALAAVVPRIRAPEGFSRRVAQLPGGWREPPETPWSNAPEWGSRKPIASPGGERRSDEEPGSAPGAEGKGPGSHPEPGEDGAPTPTGGPGGKKAGERKAGGTGREADGTARGSGEGDRGGEGGRGASGQGGAQQTGAADKSGEEGQDQQDETPSGTDGTTHRGAGQDEQSQSAAGAGTGDQSARPNVEGQEEAAGSIDLLKPLLILLALLLLLLLLAYLIYRMLKNRRKLPSFGAWAAEVWAMAVAAVRETLARIASALAALWARFLALFGWRPRIRLGADGLPEDPFADIFADRELAATLTPAQVVRHVYAAFQALMELNGYRRPDNETPFEFAKSLPSYIGGMPRPDADEITALYAKAAYSPEEVGGEEVAAVREVWQRMQGPIDQALANRRRPSAPSPEPSPA